MAFLSTTWSARALPPPPPPPPLPHSPTPSLLLFFLRNMSSTEAIEDPKTIGILNKIGYRNIGYLGALVQKWTNLAEEDEISFTEWILDTPFRDEMEKFVEAAKQQGKLSSQNMRFLKKQVEDTKEELAGAKKDITRLVSVNKDLYAKIDKLLHPHSISIDRIRDTLVAFNKENPAAVANGGGVTFGAGHAKINSVDRLAEFLATVHARKLGLPSNIIATLKVFVLEGRLVTLSGDFHGGVGYSFLWKKKKTAKGVVGWASAEAKKYDPRLGVDPATGVNYIDPETGRMWIHPELVEQSSEPKKRGVSETTPGSAAKKIRLESGGGDSSSSGSEQTEKTKSGDDGDSVSVSENEGKMKSGDDGDSVSVSENEDKMKSGDDGDGSSVVSEQNDGGDGDEEEEEEEEGEEEGEIPIP